MLKQIDDLQIKYNLSHEEAFELTNYISICSGNCFIELSQANKYITKNKLWNEFSSIRALNDHGLYRRIEGIYKDYFYIVIQELGIKYGNGYRLSKSERY